MFARYRPSLLTARLAVLVTVLVTGLSLAPAPQAAAAPPGPGQAENGTRLTDGAGLYPRAISLTHAPRRQSDGRDGNGTIVASVVSFPGGVAQGLIFTSRDHGRSFTRVGAVRDPRMAQGLCCATLYELPRAVGELRAGTLLWSASVGQDGGPDRRMSLPVYASTDVGRTWRLLSTIATSPGFGGLWEPEFSVSADGRLVVHVSDETQQPTHSQTLVQSVSRDGRTWSPLRNVVAAADPALRPGMPVVRRLPDRSYLMSYEICGPTTWCEQRIRRSTDGVHWGRVTALGHRVLTGDGRQFRHAPTISWYDDGSRQGRLLAVGQMVYDAGGDVARGNGSLIFHTRRDPSEPWRSAAAPVAIQAPYDNFCPNYSSTLVPMPERRELLEIATGYDSTGECTAYFAVGALPR